MNQTLFKSVGWFLIVFVLGFCLFAFFYNLLTLAALVWNSLYFLLLSLAKAPKLLSIGKRLP